MPRSRSCPLAGTEAPRDLRATAPNARGSLPSSSPSLCVLLGALRRSAQAGLLYARLPERADAEPRKREQELTDAMQERDAHELRGREPVEQRARERMGRVRKLGDAHGV